MELSNASSSSKGRWGELHNALSEHLFLYCERGKSEALFAEPFMRPSCWLRLLRYCCCWTEGDAADHMLLIALVFVIGLGSLAVDLLAHEASLLADMIPIDVFNSSLLAALSSGLNGWPVAHVV